MGKNGVIVTLVILSVAIGALYLLDHNDSAKVQANAGTATECPVTEFGNGVYYFGCNKATFGRELSSPLVRLRHHEVTVSKAVAVSVVRGDLYDVFTLR